MGASQHWISRENECELYCLCYFAIDVYWAQLELRPDFCLSLSNQKTDRVFNYYIKLHTYHSRFKK
jgi:hypothetical protein